jgi:hypothetical protein
VDALALIFLRFFFAATGSWPTSGSGLASPDDGAVWMSGVSSFIARF